MERGRIGTIVDTAEAVVIGGGVVGCAVLLELSARGIEAILVESEPDIGEGASKANSAIIHTGFDAKPGTLEAPLLRRSAARWPELLEVLGVPALTCGALMLARTADDAARLGTIQDVAAEHGVETEIIDAAWVRQHAPYVDPAASAALHVPGEAIVDPFWLTRAYAEAAIAMGGRVLTDARVARIAVAPDSVEIGLADGRSIRAGQVFDCAGVRADEVAALAGDTSFTLTPRKGQFLVSERTFGVDRIVLPIPGPLGKGMLVTPIVFGGVLLGPTAEDGDDKADRSTTDDGRRRILAACRELVPDVDGMEPIRSFAGVRAVSSTGDYVIRASTAGDRLTIVAGIRSTGVSASPAIAEAAVELASAARGWSARPAARLDPLAGPQLGADAGPVVCVCRSVGGAEVAAALTGPAAAVTTDGLKRRCGVGFGDCQGNRCLGVSIELVARARRVSPTEVDKHLGGAWLVAAVGDPKPAGDLADWLPSVRGMSIGDAARPEALVVGGGLAGIGAAVALADAGIEVLVVDRGSRPGGALTAVAGSGWTDPERAAAGRVVELIEFGRVRWWTDATVVGLGESPSGWTVEVAGTAESRSVEARCVILATGSYLEPREHRSIDGPRPSGIMTADFATDALDRGWLPGRRAFVSGQGRIARSTVERLVRAGVEVIGGGQPAELAAEDKLDELSLQGVRGERRLEAVNVGGSWIVADTLVMADAVRPASFLLRGLGIGDERPGVPMPADASGALPLPRLWAAGTCVDPRIDHDRSLDAGMAVGRVVAAALAGSGLTAIADLRA
ncbi:MAG: FAD-dependent oxidoreductase [Chloroflexi bacterium]|nr:FAD-dependent oxidoreductase [Chloroflexota bacterium]